jgi:hypothetical protein
VVSANMRIVAVEEQSPRVVLYQGTIDRLGFYDFAFRNVPRTAGQVRSKSASC